MLASIRDASKLMPFVDLYFLPSAKDGINRLTEEAILKADRIGVKVLSLAAFNKYTMAVKELVLSRKMKTICYLDAEQELR
ncbi:hypothetical protein Lser_V15G12018 [Lactuca serriola]